MATPLPAPMHADIDITGDSFPVETQVFIGGTVTWTNDDDDAHTVTSSDGSFGGTLEHGQKLSATFTKAGVFHYLCLYHTFMTGSIRVVAP
jgi:plastocyanin